ncbi:MAG TPA: hypothetical protein VLF41_01535 [Candidatus Nanoarchaeia archaeon]|nr:hypothetical protein [Candidatus Nanoarchaeia archaeon]
MLIQRIIYGTLIIAIGVITLKYNYQLVNTTGRQDWIENILGGGSTYFAFKLFSIILVLGGLLYMTGLGSGVAQQILSPLGKALNPGNN